jgi:hypothetical protein
LFPPTLESCTGHNVVSGCCYGMVFDSTFFWLYRPDAGGPISLVKGGWTASGSADAIRAHFAAVLEPVLLVLLRAMLSAVGKLLCYLDGRAYLGSDASGHLFAVGDAKRPLALKVMAVENHHSHVPSEFHRLAAAAARCTAVVPPEPGSCTNSVAWARTARFLVAVPPAARGATLRVRLKSSVRGCVRLAG